MPLRNMLTRTGLPVLAAALLALAAGCVSPRVNEPATPAVLPSTFSGSGEAALPVEWWSSFNDAQLNALVAEALAANPGLLGAWERLRQAEAAAAQEGATKSPTLDASGSASRTRNVTPERTTYANAFALGLAASYEVDLWGGLAASREAKTLAAQASADDLRTAAITLCGEVASTWYTLVEQQARMAVLRQVLQTNQTQLTVLEKRYDLGQSEASDVVQQRQLVAATEATIATLEGSLRSSAVQLNLLLGRSPNAELPEAATLPSLPPLPATGVPAEILQRRPDLAAALARLRSADYAYAAAVTERLPSLTLSGSATTSGLRTQDLFRNWAASLASGIAGPVIDGGRRKTAANQARSAADELYWSWVEQLLAAAGEVESAYATEAAQGAYLGKVDEQLRHAKEAAELLKTRYYQGSDTFTSYLQAVKSVQELELSQVAGRGTLLRDRVALCRALAGPIPVTEPDPLPSRVDHFLISRENPTHSTTETMP